ncbi:MAG TPA: hypothetical protein VKQ52_04165 [Puia sp.]|nr:hypothetical protein [Puia sp.]
MKSIGTWTYRIIMLLLVVFLIDFDCTNMRRTVEKSNHMILTNLVLGGLFLLLLISQINKKRL